jgi:hypothetical protein
VLPDGSLCTYDPSAGPTCGCQDDLPKVCPTPTPSFKDSVLPALADKCQACHSTNGFPFDTYAHVYKERITMLTRVAGCRMPPACAPQPTSDQRQAILGWLKCGAPDN